MKHSLFGLTGIGTFLLTFSACNGNEELATQDGMLQSIHVSAKDFETDADTRTAIIVGGSGVEFAWAANDTIGIFPETGAQAYFPMSSGAGTKTASFTGGGWALKSASTYAAYYPLVGRFYLDRHAVPVGYTGQTQTGDASTAHLGAYDYMVAPPVTPTGGSASFIFDHLSCLVRFQLTLAKAATVNSVTFQPSEGSFTTEGTVDLMTATPAIKATKTASSLTLEVKSVSTSEANQTVTLYMMFPPIDLTGKTLKAIVKASTGGYSLDLGGKNFVAGKAYALSASTATEGGDSSTGSDDESFDGLVLTVPEAGWLADKDLSAINSIKLKGNLNGTDIKVIRSWAQTKRDLLDLSDAHIVSGGDYYTCTHYSGQNAPKNVYFYTKDNIISEYMFGCLSKNNDPCKIASIVLPTDVTTIEDYAFDGCSSLTSIDIPNSVTEIGYMAFYECSSLTSVIIPEGITEIDAFSCCSSLMSVTLPNSLTSIDGFDGCSSLTSIDIPSGVTSIRSGAFWGCSSLTSINIPSSVTSIGGWTFSYCSSLTSVTIPSSVTSIENGTFYNCN